MSLSGRPMKVHHWLTNELTDELESAIKKFDSGYSLDITSWNDVEKKMPVIFSFINDKNTTKCQNIWSTSSFVAKIIVFFHWLGRK